MRRTLTVMGFIICLGCAATAVTVAEAPSQMFFDAAASTAARTWFGPQAIARPFTVTSVPVTVREIATNGQRVGWIYRTDTVPPKVKGKHGEIVLLVGFGVDGRIKGTELFSHQETPRFFNRIREPFYRQFANRPLTDHPASYETVTRATLSSRAMIREVVEGTAYLAQLPEFKDKINTPNNTTRK